MPMIAAAFQNIKKWSLGKLEVNGGSKSNDVLNIGIIHERNNVIAAKKYRMGRVKRQAQCPSKLCESVG